MLNNFIAMGYATIYCEALALGIKAGLTPAVFVGVIRDGGQDCPIYRTFFKCVLEQPRRPRIRAKECA